MNLELETALTRAIGQRLDAAMIHIGATIDALKREDSPRAVAARRGLKVSAIQARRGDTDGAGADA